MHIASRKEQLFGNTLISDRFITEYMSGLDGNSVRLYLLLLYIDKTGLNVERESLPAMLNIAPQELNAAMIQLNAAGIITEDETGITLECLPMKEIERNYRPKTVRRPDEIAADNASPDEKAKEMAKIRMIKAVSDRFFSGQMPTSWYGEIDLWIEKYDFNMEVIYMLFQHCMSNGAVTRPYMRAVADSWGGKYHIKTVEQLNNYLKNYEGFRKFAKSLQKSLKKESLTKYDLEYAEKWYMEYSYDFDITEKAMRLATGAGIKASFRLYDAILTDWHVRGLKTAEEIDRYIDERRKSGKTRKESDGTKSGNAKSAGSQTLQKDSYGTRKYDDDFYDQFFTY